MCLPRYFSCLFSFFSSNSYYFLMVIKLNSIIQIENQDSTKENIILPMKEATKIIIIVKTGPKIHVCFYTTEKNTAFIFLT